MCALASNLFFIFQLQNKEMLWEWKGFKKVSVKQEKQALCGDLFYFVRWLSNFTLLCCEDSTPVLLSKFMLFPLSRFMHTKTGDQDELGLRADYQLI